MNPHDRPDGRRSELSDDAPGGSGTTVLIGQVVTGSQTNNFYGQGNAVGTVTPAQPAQAAPADPPKGSLTRRTLVVNTSAGVIAALIAAGALLLNYTRTKDESKPPARTPAAETTHPQPSPIPQGEPKQVPSRPKSSVADWTFSAEGDSTKLENLPSSLLGAKSFGPPVAEVAPQPPQAAPTPELPAPAVPPRVVDTQPQVPKPSVPRSPKARAATQQYLASNGPTNNRSANVIIEKVRRKKKVTPDDVANFYVEAAFRTMLQ